MTYLRGLSGELMLQVVCVASNDVVLITSFLLSCHFLLVLSVKRSTVGLLFTHHEANQEIGFCKYSFA